MDEDYETKSQELALRDDLWTVPDELSSEASFRQLLGFDPAPPRIVPLNRSEKESAKARAEYRMEYSGFRGDYSEKYKTVLDTLANLNTENKGRVNDNLLKLAGFLPYI